MSLHGTGTFLMINKGQTTPIIDRIATTMPTHCNHFLRKCYVLSD